MKMKSFLPLENRPIPETSGEAAGNRFLFLFPNPSDSDSSNTHTRAVP